MISLRAEFAGDLDDTFFGALVDLFCGEASQNSMQPLTRTRALVTNRRSFENAHTVLMEQPIQQAFRADSRVQKFIRFDSCDQRLRFRPGIVFNMTILAVVAISAMKV